MKVIKYSVQGSGAEPYTVEAKKLDNQLRFKCNCQAGQFNTPCKHWKSLFNNSFDKLESDLSPENLKTIQGWLDGSDLDNIVKDLNNIADELIVLKKKESRVKTKLKNLMKETFD